MSEYAWKRGDVVVTKIGGVPATAHVDDVAEQARLAEWVGLGDVSGHDFHGNQHTGGIGGGDSANPARNPLVVMGSGSGVATARLIAYVQKNGRAYAAPTSLPAGVEMGPAKNCYMNASHLVMDSHLRGTGALSYVEGFVTVPGLPKGMAILHAWAATKDGTVVDNTLRDAANAHYFGVPYNTTDYMRHMVQTKTFGVLGGSDKGAQAAVDNNGIG